MKIPLSNPDITAKERRYVREVLKTPSLSLGPRLPEFERRGALAAGRKYAVAVNSGTSGLHLIIKALGIGKEDVVITTPFSFISSANCLLFEGARPLFVDIDPYTLNISPDSIRALLRRGKNKNIKAILAVDVFGHPADWDALYAIAEEYNLLLVEDSCEAIGARYISPQTGRRRWKSYRPAGSFGAAGVFAFYPNKQITTGEGGLIVTDRKDMYNLCCSLRNQGRGSGANWFNHERLGYNYRISDINCALGIAQLERLDEILARRERVARSYTKRLSSIEGIRVPYCAQNITMSWFVYVVRLAQDLRRKDRDTAMKLLRDHGIACSNYFAPIHLQPFYRKMFGFKRGDFPITEHVADRTIALPFYSRLQKKEIEYIAEELARSMEKVG